MIVAIVSSAWNRRLVWRTVWKGRDSGFAYGFVLSFAIFKPDPQAWTRVAGSATDAVANVGGLGCVDHPKDRQLDTRRQHLEQPAATTEQHRDLVDLHLVQHPGLEHPLRRVRA